MENPSAPRPVLWDHEPRVCLTLTRNLTLTLRSSIKITLSLRSSIKIESRIKSKKSSAQVHGETPLAFVLRR